MVSYKPNALGASDIHLQMRGKSAEVGFRSMAPSLHPHKLLLLMLHRALRPDQIRRG